MLIAVGDEILERLHFQLCEDGYFLMGYIDFFDAWRVSLSVRWSLVDI